MGGNIDYDEEGSGYGSNSGTSFVGERSMGSRAACWVVALPFLSAYGVPKANEDPPVVRPPYSVQSLPAGNLATVPADLPGLLKARLEAARTENEARMTDFLADRGNVDPLLESSRRELNSELDFAAADADRVAALERYWARAWLVDKVAEGWKKAGRIPYKQSWEARYERLKAEVELAQFRNRPGVEKNTAWSGLPPALELAISSVVPAKVWADAKLEASRSDAMELRKEMRDLAERAWDSRMKEFLEGRGTMNVLLTASHRRLESELALARNDTARQAALEQYLDVTRTIEERNRLRMEAGRIPRGHYLESHYARLEAELWWLQAVRKK
jgi:hypothetical protein